MAKKLNTRCPLQEECERKCEFANNELECDYYKNNARPGMEIPDQEEIRRQREAEADRKFWESEDDGVSRIVMLPIDRLHPHPDNPRKELGDLTELAESIKAKGVLQNLTVVPFEGDWRVIIGHRRSAAGKLAGLTEMPCVVTYMTPQEQVETMLLENMQREDLTVYEQAQGFQMMIDMGGTVESVAEKTGFSKKTVKRRLKMAELDQGVLKEVSDRQISLSDFDELAKIEDIGTRNTVLKSIGTNNFAGEVKNAIKKQEVRKNVPIAQKLVKELKATKIELSDTYGCEYERLGKSVDLEKWDGVTHPVPEGETRKLFYLLETRYYNELRFYVKKPKAKPKKRSKEEVERGKKIAAAHAEADRLTKLCYELRKAFAEGLAMGRDNQLAVLQAAVLASIGQSIGCISRGYKSTSTVLGKDVSSYSATRGKNLVAAFDDVDPKDYIKVLYFALNDSADRSYCSSHKDKFPEFRDCEELEIIYTVLTWLGYEMSDDEIALRNGTHELFQLDKPDTTEMAEVADEVKADPCTACKAAHPDCDKCCTACEDKCNGQQECRKSQGEE